MNLARPASVEEKSVSLLDSIPLFRYIPDIGYAILAQLAEHMTCNLEVLGSIPRDGCDRRFDMERFPSGQRGQTVNLLAMPSKVQILLSPKAFPLMLERLFIFQDGTYVL
jgi:hypothetical protein